MVCHPSPSTYDQILKCLNVLLVFSISQFLYCVAADLNLQQYIILYTVLGNILYLSTSWFCLHTLCNNCMKYYTCSSWSYFIFEHQLVLSSYSLLQLHGILYMQFLVMFSLNGCFILLIYLYESAFEYHWYCADSLFFGFSLPKQWDCASVGGCCWYYICSLFLGICSLYWPSLICTCLGHYCHQY